MMSPGSVATPNAVEAGLNSCAMLEANENVRVARTVASGATSSAVALAPAGLKRPKTDTSESRLPVKRIRVAPATTESAERAGIAKPKEEPSSRGR